ncbi:hypothetical protein [Microcoleus sp. herbarium12]|uniref:hypothetical protein n=1 Tax=Microcoleus sp. herbarium12 TaxID=3055437 RepID=UPI002FD7314A
MSRSSLKAALDLDWDDPQQKTEALTRILETLNNVESWVTEQTDLNATAVTQAKQSIEDARIIEAQDTDLRENGSAKLRKGVAPNRRISIENKDMRHGRKSSNKCFNR